MLVILFSYPKNFIESELTLGEPLGVPAHISHAFPTCIDIWSLAASG
tara:strand:+ start:809 stop:949 length:141 start_codon:yes stop_codon:yes gene_type:complete